MFKQPKMEECTTVVGEKFLFFNYFFYFSRVKSSSLLLSVFRASRLELIKVSAKAGQTLDEKRSDLIAASEMKPPVLWMWLHCMLCMTAPCLWESQSSCRMHTGVISVVSGDGKVSCKGKVGKS